MKKKDKTLNIFLIILIAFFIISIISIYSFKIYLPTSQDLVLKQTIFYIIGFLIILILYKIDINIILKYSIHFYIICIILLILVLFLGTEVNDTKAWFSFPIIGSLQPSELMKIALVLIISRIIEKTKIKTTKDEFLLILKVLLITIIPSIITFLEPDTGAVIIYFIIAIVMLFISGIRLRWFISLGGLFIMLISTVLFLFFFNSNIFINTFGSTLFYRLDRLFDWTTSEGMQLQNSLISISSSNIFGHGFNNIPIYYPEGQTDFIFTSFVSCFGLIGSLVLIIIYIIFNNKILNIAKNNNKLYKFIIIGFFSIIFYQQIQNIAMTIGLLPITGITLPFISYGGSSLLSFMIIIGIILSINKKALNN